MTRPGKPPPQQPARTPAAEAERAARLDREAAALRANLHRRKAQIRARTAADQPSPETIDSQTDESPSF